MSEAPGTSVPRVGIGQVARSPRMLGLLALFLAVAAACGFLGTWQLERSEVRGASAAAAREAELRTQDPVALEALLAPQTTFEGALVGRRVEVTGTYEPEGQLLIVDRELDGRVGHLVLTPLRVASDDPAADGAVLPVVRGWVPHAEPDHPAVAVPQGPVSVSGYLQSSESSWAGGDLPPGTAGANSSAALLHEWTGPIWTGYAVLTELDPVEESGIALLPVPQRSGTGLNIQNLGYAGQWFTFAGFAVFLWVRLLKDEVLVANGEIAARGT